MQSHVRMIWIGFLCYYVFAVLMAAMGRFAANAVLVLAILPFPALGIVRYFAQSDLREDKDYFVAKTNLRHVYLAMFAALFIAIVAVIYAAASRR